MLHTILFTLLSVLGNENDSVFVVVRTSPQTRGIQQHEIPQVIPKSPGKATLISLGHTLIPTAAGLAIAVLGSSNVEGSRAILAFGSMTYGLAIGPSMGNFYAKDYARGTAGVGVRIVAAGLVASSIGQAMANGNDDEYDGSNDGKVATLFFGGLALYFGSTIWNIATAPSSARRYNSKQGLQIAPSYNPLDKSYHVGLQLSF